MSALVHFLHRFSICQRLASVLCMLLSLLCLAAPAQAVPIISTYAGTPVVSGNALAVGLDATSVAFDSAGNYYVAVARRSIVVKVNVGTGLVSTVAGNGAPGYSGDGGAATAAQLHFPNGVAVDVAGNLYIADNGNNRIRKVDGSGKISTVAGTGTRGYSGDGGPATAAQLNFPTGVAVDAAGNLYIADGFNSSIRKVTASGTISTVAGNGSSGYSGDGGAATAAQLSAPFGVAVDAAGNLYIADYSNNRIRKVTTSGTISTVAGTGTRAYSGDGGPATAAQLYAPSGVAVDVAGNLYIVEKDNARVRKVDGSGTISTVAGNGTMGYGGDGGVATAALLSAPYGVTVDAAGNLYIADSGNNRVRKVAGSGKISTVAGNGAPGYSSDGGAATGAQLRTPTGVAVDAAGNLYIADTGNARVRKVTTSGTISTVAGNGSAGYGGDGGAATAAQLSAPRGVAVDATGNLYIADADNARVRKVSTSGTISTVAGNGSSGYSGDGSAATAAQLSSPRGVVVNAAGTLFVADYGSNVIRRVAEEAPPPPTPTPTIPPLPVAIPGATALPGIIDMASGEGPAFMADLVAMLSSALGQPLQLVGQNAQGTVTLSGYHGGVLAFVPHSFQTGNNRANGIYLLDDGSYQIVRADQFGGQSLVIAPALVRLDQLLALLPGVSARQADNGVLIATYNGVTYAVLPGVAVQSEAATGHAQLRTGGDGYLHFIDSLGNNQALYPAFADVWALRNALRGLDLSATLSIQLGGTAAIAFKGQRYTLVADATLSGVPAERAGQSVWQEGAGPEGAPRYRVVNDQPMGTAQGLTVNP